jgi:hypothetical protein
MYNVEIKMLYYLLLPVFRASLVCHEIKNTVVCVQLQNTVIYAILSQLVQLPIT